jgi:hypothetical protein
MKSKFGVLLLLLIVVWLVRCGDAPPQRPENPIPTAPTPAPPPPPPLPLIAGTWNGTLTFLSSADGRKCPVSMEIEQPGAGQEVSGSIRAEECFFARFEAQLVRQGSIWVISGRAHFSLISDDYCSYRASLNGHLEGSPDSRLIASTTGFRCATQPDRSGIGLELTRSAR